MAGGDLVAKVGVGVGVAIADRHPGYLGLFGRHLADSGEVPETRHYAITPGMSGTQRKAGCPVKVKVTSDNVQCVFVRFSSVFTSSVTILSSNSLFNSGTGVNSGIKS
jgi:hypothetical protein